MLRLIAAIALTSALAACSWTDVARVLGPPMKQGVEAEVVVGKKEEEVAVNTHFGEEKQIEQTADQIINTTSGLTTIQLLIFAVLAGWALPDPQTMGRGIVSFLKAVVPWAK